VGVGEVVQLILAPLQPYQAPNGKIYPYYACQEKLAELANSMSARNKNILVMVDGPPGSTGQHARYPALPLILNTFKNKNIDVILDDYFRNDEKEIGAMWQQDFELANYKISTEILSMEKGAIFMQGTPTNHK
jgi:hypothetical protein